MLMRVRFLRKNDCSEMFEVSHDVVNEFRELLVLRTR